MVSEAFLKSEIADVEKELEKARIFIVQAETTLGVYRMLLSKFKEVEE